MTIKEEVFIIESPIAMLEGETIQFCVEWLGATRLSNPVVVVYQNGKDISSKVMIAFDDFEISGNILIMRKISALLHDGGTEYVVIIQCGVDTNIERRKLVIEVIKANK